jgi:hypothetical protein
MLQIGVKQAWNIKNYRYVYNVSVSSAPGLDARVMINRDDKPVVATVGCHIEKTRCNNIQAESLSIETIGACSDHRAWCSESAAIFADCVDKVIFGRNCFF